MKANRTLVISNLDQLLRWWNFLREGLNRMRTELKWEKTDDEYFKTMLKVIENGDKYGIIMVLVSGSGEPYGYLVAIDNTAPFSPPSVNVYVVYSNDKCRSAVAELSTEAQQWAVSNGFKEVQACSYRVSGGAIYWFEKKMGFRRKFMVFSKKL